LHYDQPHSLAHGLPAGDDVVDEHRHLPLEVAQVPDGNLNVAIAAADFF